MGSTSVSEFVSHTRLLNDEIVSWFTPKPFRKNQRFGIGYLLAFIPSLITTLPILVVYFQAGRTLKGILLLIFLAVVIVGSLSLISFGRAKAVLAVANLEKVLHPDDLPSFLRIVSEALVFRRQIISGIVFAIPVVAIGQGSSSLTNIWVRLSASLSLAYAGFIVGAGFYLVLSIPRILRNLTQLRFRSLTLFPYQTLELKQIANVGSSISLFGAFTVTIITILFLLAAPISGIFGSFYWRMLSVGILILNWTIISIPYIYSNFILRHIIEQAKNINLMQLNTAIGNIFKHISDADMETLERLEKLQALYDQVYRSPNNIRDWSIAGRYLSSLLITVIPTAISLFLQKFLP